MFMYYEMAGGLKGAQRRGGKAIQNSRCDVVGISNNRGVSASSRQISEGVHSVAAESVSSYTCKRGPYRGHSLDKDYRQQGDKMKIEFAIDGGRPLTTNQSARMASEMGKACRDLLPLYIDGDWRTLPMEEKQRAWERVQVV